MGDDPQYKRMIGLYLAGEGAVTGTVYVDGREKASKAFDFASNVERDRLLQLPQNTQGRAIQVKLVGTGKVNEAIVE